MTETDEHRHRDADASVEPSLDWPAKAPPQAAGGEEAVAREEVMHSEETAGKNLADKPSAEQMAEEPHSSRSDTKTSKSGTTSAHGTEKPHPLKRAKTFIDPDREAILASLRMEPTMANFSAMWAAMSEIILKQDEEIREIRERQEEQDEEMREVQEQGNFKGRKGKKLTVAQAFKHTREEIVELRSQLTAAQKQLGVQATQIAQLQQSALDAASEGAAHAKAFSTLQFELGTLADVVCFPATAKCSDGSPAPLSMRG
eukprot:293614-Pleurochrysis_carterae.AAC.1